MEKQLEGCMLFEMQNFKTNDGKNKVSYWEGLLGTHSPFSLCHLFCISNIVNGFMKIHFTTGNSRLRLYDSISYFNVGLIGGKLLFNPFMKPKFK